MRVVFIHGAFSRDGAWWWAPVAARLERSGIASAAVALPSCGEAGVAPTGAGPDLHDDAAATTALLDEDGGPTILAAHSYGGMVASQAGEHPAVQALVYISSFLPAAGEDLAALSRGPNPVPVIPHEDGSVRVDDRDTAAFDARFLHDVTDPELVRGAHERLCSQSSAVFGAATTTAAWQRIPSTYLACAEERGTDPDLQRAQAARASTVHELAAGHFPFLSRPDLVAARVEEIARHAWASRPQADPPTGPSRPLWNGRRHPRALAACLSPVTQPGPEARSSRAAGSGSSEMATGTRTAVEGAAGASAACVSASSWLTSPK